MQEGRAKLFDLVYVSSDNDSDQMKGEIEGGWDSIDYEKKEDRSMLKKCFGICAQKEMEALGITSEQRKGGIPTLLLIDKGNSVVISPDGIPDLMGDNKVEDPLAKWKALLLPKES